MPITITETKSPLEHTSFAVRLPASIFQAFDEPNVNPVMAAILQDTGVVGTITVMRKSVMIWFGWGKLESSSQGQASNAASAVESACKCFIISWFPFNFFLTACRHASSFSSHIAYRCTTTQPEILPWDHLLSPCRERNIKEHFPRTGKHRQRD